MCHKTILKLQRKKPMFHNKIQHRSIKFQIVNFNELNKKKKSVLSECYWFNVVLLVPISNFFSF